MALESVHETALAGELVVEVTREVIARHEHVRLAAEAPAERGTLPVAGARQ